MNIIPEKKLTYRAGTIPYVIEEGRVVMMFMKPSDTMYGGDAWQIAKGKVEDEEDHLHAALREGKEELGLFLGNVTLTSEVGVFMGRTTVFVSHVKNRDMFGAPSDETSDVVWLTMEEFDMVGRELHRPVVRASYRKILEIEGL